MSPRPGLRLRVKRWRCRLAREARSVLGLNRTVYVDQRLAEYRGYWEGAARILGADFTALTEGIWEVRLGGRRTRIAGYVVAADDPVTLRVAGNKALCHRIAAEAGAPVPDHLVFRLDELERARAHLARSPGLWVVKPVSGSSSGLGITTGVRTPAELESAAVLASLFGPELMLERMVPGESCRVLFLDGEMIHAARRRGVRVAGDGRASLRRLAAPHGGVDDLVEATLRAQRLTPEDVPERGREVVLRGVPAPGVAARELRTVYDETITHLVHPETARLLARVVRGLGSRFAGVDVVTHDPSVPLAGSGGAFLEINTTPGIHHHYHTAEERRDHPVAVRVLRALLGADAGRVSPSPREPALVAANP